MKNFKFFLLFLSTFLVLGSSLFPRSAVLASVDNYTVSVASDCGPATDPSSCKEITVSLKNWMMGDPLRCYWGGGYYGGGGDYYESSFTANPYGQCPGSPGWTPTASFPDVVRSVLGSAYVVDKVQVQVSVEMLNLYNCGTTVSPEIAVSFNGQELGHGYAQARPYSDGSDHWCIVGNTELTGNLATTGNFASWGCNNNRPCGFTSLGASTAMLPATNYNFSGENTVALNITGGTAIRSVAVKVRAIRAPAIKVCGGVYNILEQGLCNPKCIDIASDGTCTTGSPGCRVAVGPECPATKPCYCPCPNKPYPPSTQIFWGLFKDCRDPANGISGLDVGNNVAAASPTYSGKRVFRACDYDVSDNGVFTYAPRADFGYVASYGWCGMEQKASCAACSSKQTFDPATMKWVATVNCSGRQDLGYIITKVCALPGSKQCGCHPTGNLRFGDCGKIDAQYECIFPSNNCTLIYPWINKLPAQPDCGPSPIPPSPTPTPTPGGVHYECTAKQRCLAAAGAGDNQCSPGDYDGDGRDASCQVDHSVCQGGRCVAILGAGESDCRSSLDCQGTHKECNGRRQCVEAIGNGPSFCQENDDCMTYTRCNPFKKCVEVSGTIFNESNCTSNDDCNQSYLDCNYFKKCKVFFGLGTDNCQVDADCVNPTHLECNASQKCVQVDGQGSPSCVVGDITPQDGKDDSCQHNPNATNLIIAPTDVCKNESTPKGTYFQWIYTDPDPDDESRLSFQVDNNSDFSSPEMGISLSVSMPSGSLNAQFVPLSTDPAGPGSGRLNYNKIYYWRVRVLDETGMSSGWVNGIPFITPNHPFPEPNFSLPVNGVNQPLELYKDKPITFTDSSTCFVNGTVSYECSMEHTPTGTSNVYTWKFGDGQTSSDVGDSTHTYSVPGTYNVTLTVQDNLGKCSFSQEIVVQDSHNICWIANDGIGHTYHSCQVTGGAGEDQCSLANNNPNPCPPLYYCSDEQECMNHHNECNDSEQCEEKLGNGVSECNIPDTEGVCLKKPPSATNLNYLQDYSCVTATRFNDSVFFSWTYESPNSTAQASYDLEVDNESDFSSPEVSMHHISAPNSQKIMLDLINEATPGSNHLSYHTTYYWRVQVWDVNNKKSGWIDGDALTTRDHSYPQPYFTTSGGVTEGDETIFPVGQQVNFNDLSLCYSSNGANQYCETNPYSADGPYYYNWQFGDGDGTIISGWLASNGDTSHTYNSSGLYVVIFGIVDKAHNQDTNAPTGCAFADAVIVSGMHNECNDQHQCKTLVGKCPVGTDCTCQTDADCGEGHKPLAQDLTIVLANDCLGVPGCGQILFNWNYFDPDQDFETRYDIQVDDNADFSSPEVSQITSGFDYPSNTLNSSSVSVRIYDTYPDCNYIAYDETYYWRVRVWDDTGLNSGWIEYNDIVDPDGDGNPKTFLTYQHAWPHPAFSFSPSGTEENKINFVDSSRCYDQNDDDYYCKETNPITNSHNKYTWSFGDGTTSSVVGNVSHVFPSAGTYNVSLEICDASIIPSTDGACCPSDPQSVSVGKGQKIQWKEIPPF